MSGLQTILDPTLQSPEAQDFENALRQRVVGQDRAVRRLSHVFQVHKSGLVAETYGTKQRIVVKQGNRN